jgi:hypothetical protein
MRASAVETVQRLPINLHTITQAAVVLIFHDLAGWLMMPLALGILWLELKVLSFLLVDAGGEETSPVDFTGRGVSRLEPAQG